MFEGGVSWQRVGAAVAALALALASVVVIVRSDGFDAVDATAPRATRWFANQATGQIVLADGFAGRALARLDTAATGQLLEIVQGATGVALIDRTAGTARAIDAAELRLGPPQSIGVVSQLSTIVGIAQPGLVAVDTDTADVVVVPPGGDSVTFDLGVAGGRTATRIAPDGAVWTLADGRLRRVTSATDQVIAAGLSEARFSLVGSDGLVLDLEAGEVRFGNGDWVELPTDADPSEIVLQEPGPRAECGWAAANDDLWCIGGSGIVERSTVDGLDVDGADRLAIGGDAAVVVRAAPASIVRFDWRTGRMLDDDVDAVADVPAGSVLDIATTIDLVWIDQVNGGLVWAAHPWGLEGISKDDQSAPLLGEAGDVIEAGQSGAAATGDDVADDLERPPPDDNGVDDPPIAVDDPVTARTGAPVPVAVTRNDYDPDGEAIVLVAVGEPANGTVEIATGTTVVYQPSSGFVGQDRFEYTIADGDGTTATAIVTIDLLATDAANQAPVGRRDRAETGPDAPVVVDVLLNDIDPERDSLRIDSFTPPDVGGTLSEVRAPSGLQGIRFEPETGASGTASFTYRPVDALGAVGEPVVVQIDIAQPSDENRPPIAGPDSVRIRRGVQQTVPVLANDRDPDGDSLILSLPDPLPDGLRARVVGAELELTVLAGSAELLPFTYLVEDGNGNETRGAVLVAVISELEPNRAPVANADTASAVVGSTQLIDVLLNDSDPDGDPLVIVGVGTTGAASLSIQGDRIRYSPAPLGSADDSGVDRFTYTITDGNGHTADGEVTVRVLPEPIAAPPFAQDDAATTVVDVPVTLDVLRNDGDPSGERPTLVGAPGCAGGGTAVVTSDERVAFTPPDGESGVFRCTYEVTNRQGLRAGATIVITVLEPAVSNEPPIVNDEDVVVIIGETVEIDVLANDRDSDGPRSELRVLSSTTPVLGSAVRDGGIIRFDAGTVLGVVAIVYQVGDARGGVSGGRLVIRIVEPDPEPPVATDDVWTITGPGVPTVIEVVANDTDPDGDPGALVITEATLRSGTGAISVGRRSITFDPDPEFVGDLVVDYVVVDPDGFTAGAVATLTVLEAPNRPPVAVDDEAQIVNGGTVVVELGFNDSDPDGDPVTFSLLAPPDAALGAANLAGDTLTFVAVPGASGTAVIPYRIDDGEDTADAVVRIDVLPCAVAPPEAPDVVLETGYEQPIAVDLTTAARNGEIVEVGAPLGAAQSVYTPPPGENGNIVVDYVVRNACRVQAVGTVTIDVNQDPVAAPYATAIGRIEPVVIAITQLASDDEPLRFVGLEGQPEWVTVVDDVRAIRIEPAGQSGRIEFVAVVADPGDLTARVPVAIDLVNLAPNAVDDRVELPRGAVTFAPLANDNDPDGDALAVAEVPETFAFPDGRSGTITVEPDGRLRVDPLGGSGVATFTYRAIDALGALSDQVATVTLVVNSAPLAPDQEITVPAGTQLVVPLEASDPDGHAITVELLDEPDHWGLTLDQLLLTVDAPNGQGAGGATVRYRVTDELGLTATGTLTLVLGPAPTTTTTTSTTTTTTTSTTTTTLPSTTTTTTTTPTITTTTTTTTSSTPTTTPRPPRP